MVNHHLRRQPLQQRQLPLRFQPHPCQWHVPRYRATLQPQALGATTSLVELSADHLQELAVLETTGSDHRSLADEAARKEERIRPLLRRQPLLQRQLPSFQTGPVSMSKAVYATFEVKFLLS